MKTLKITSWNVEWMDQVWPNLTQSKYHADRRKYIAEEILMINADIICILEGISSPENMISFVDEFLPNYIVVTRQNDDDDWGIKGKQWIYFLIKKNVVLNASLMPIDEWYSKASKYWNVHFWGDLKEYNHSHYRLPQVLRFYLNDIEIELIGAHLKSKINFNSPFKSGTEEWKKEFIDTALKARIKLATEAINIRNYIDSRFKEEKNPCIFLMGDFNDGPGKERIEKEFMFFDLISALQGDIFFSNRFLNHALFDYPQDLRWSTIFKDKTDKNRDPHILLDHILFTQPLVNGSVNVQVQPGAGKVEHAIHNRVNAGLSSKKKTSDHHPVSVILNID